MHQLQVLDVSGCQQLTGKGLGALRVLPMLSVVKVQHWVDASGDGVKVGGWVGA